MNEANKPMQAAVVPARLMGDVMPQKLNLDYSNGRIQS